MRVTYIWTEREWREAVLTGTGRRDRRPILPGFTWALILVPLLGGAGDLVGNLRRSRLITLAGSILPLLLVLFAVVVALLLLLAAILRRRKHAATRATMPAGAWEAVLQEAGWRLISLPVKAEPTPAEETGPADGSGSGTLASLLRPWDEITEARYGNGVIVLLHASGFDAILTGSLSPDQCGHLHRLITRKMRPAAGTQMEAVTRG